MILGFGLLWNLLTGVVSKYKIGYYYERKTVERLKKDGWDAWRTPASKSPIDVVAIKPDKTTGKVLIKLIQVKSTSKDSFSFSNLSKEERSGLLDLALRYKDYDNVSVELWIYYKKQRRKSVINVKNYCSGK